MVGLINIVIAQLPTWTGNWIPGHVNNQLRSIPTWLRPIRTPAACGGANLQHL